MNRLSVLYDLHCGAHIRLRSWVRTQPTYLPIEFIPAGTTLAARQFPSLTAPGWPVELVAVDDQGGIYRGSQAWVMCLFALEVYRPWALRLSDPALRPLAQKAFLFLSKHRVRLSQWLLREPEQRIVEILSQEQIPGDETGAAAPPSRMLKPYGHEFPET
ncbi:MAG TPA: DCC1-like thiol-disulfide oxidoreductase family protein [Thermoanaerobaculia bacterium]|nr:DCC1-like thiol-disulfide oxidoreductase family protein [Thermoanaerobaculia bacterium]